MADINWSGLYQARRTIADRFGGIWELPVDRRYSDVLLRAVKPGMRVLEIGAGDRGLVDKLPEVDYKSCDPDTRMSHDFAHVDEVTGEFDLICGFEVIEHLSLEEAQHLLGRCQELAAPDATIMLSTPNIYYPPAFLRDVTHRTPFAHDELGALLMLAGFDVARIYRLYHDSLIKQFLRRIVLYPVFRGLGIDFSRQIMVVAVKKVV